MSIRTAVISELERIRRNANRPLPPVTDELPLLESGLDSLGIAILVTKLEDILGVDPFTDSDISVPPVTVGEFVLLYETAATPRDLDPTATK